MYAFINKINESATLYSYDPTHDVEVYDKIELTQSQIDQINGLKAIKLCFNGTDFYDAATPEEIEEGNLNYIKSKYEAHRANGWQYYQDFRANIVIDIEKQTVTEEQAFVIEEYLSVAFNRVAETGDWKTAYFKLSQVSGFPTYVQPYYDKAMADILTYIQTNYDS